jgi:hypothetical protein
MSSIYLAEMDQFLHIHNLSKPTQEEDFLDTPLLMKETKSIINSLLK